MTELEAENRLAAAILRGNIEIKETQTMMGAIVTQVVTTEQDETRQSETIHICVTRPIIISKLSFI